MAKIQTGENPGDRLARMINLPPMQSDAIIAGAGPAGLSAAAVLARSGASVTATGAESRDRLAHPHQRRQLHRGNGGSGDSARLYHPISRVRFLSPQNSAVFDYATARFCVLDVRGTFQYLAERAIAAGANVSLSTHAQGPGNRERRRLRRCKPRAANCGRGWWWMPPVTARHF